MTSEQSDAAAQELDALATSVRSLLDEHAQVEQELADPQVHSSPGRARTLTRRYAELDRIAHVWSRLQRIAGDLDAAHEMAEADPSSRTRPTSSRRPWVRSGPPSSST
jgi:peptide chain release factor 1